MCIHRVHTNGVKKDLTGHVIAWSQWSSSIFSTRVRTIMFIICYRLGGLYIYITNKRYIHAINTASTGSAETDAHLQKVKYRFIHSGLPLMLRRSNRALPFCNPDKLTTPEIHILSEMHRRRTCNGEETTRLSVRFEVIEVTQHIRIDALKHDNNIKEEAYIYLYLLSYLCTSLVAYVIRKNE